MYFTAFPVALASKASRTSTAAKQLSRSASGVAALLLAAIGTTTSAVSAHPTRFASPSYQLPPAFQSYPMTVEKELEQAALTFGVKIRTGEATFGGSSAADVAVVALQGIENYRQRDFTAGAPIQLIIVRSNTGEMPAGTYVVKAQFKPHATSGSALFVDQNGKVVASEPLLLRTWKQANILFPEVYVLPQPEEIPVISSAHAWHNGQIMVDCTGPGWNWVVFYY